MFYVGYLSKEYINFIFFFKQKTAYEMRISDWSSDVCSSDLVELGERRLGRRACLIDPRPRDVPVGKAPGNERADAEMQRGIAHQTLDRTGCRARRGAQTDRGIESCGLDADPGGRGGEPALGLTDIRSEAPTPELQSLQR